MEPLDVKDVLTMRTFAQYVPMMLAPDETLVAYTVRRSTHRGELNAPDIPTCLHSLVGATDLWITDTRTGDSRNLTNDQASNWGAAWSPDSQRLAFYSDRDGSAALWAWDRQTGSLRRLSDAAICTGRDAVELQWTPDGRQLLTRLQPEGVTPVQARPVQPSAHSTDSLADDEKPTVRVFRASPGATDTAPKVITRKNFYLNDLALLDVGSGEVRRIAKGVNPFTAQISPDGRFVAFMDDSGEYAQGSFTTLLDLKLVSLADGTSRTLARGIRMGGNNFDKNDWSWSPDSRWIAYRDTFGTRQAGLVSQAFLVSLDGEPRPLTAQSHPPFAGTPVWDSQGRFLYFMAGSEVWRVSVADGRAQSIAMLPGKTLKTIVTASANRDRLWARDRESSLVVVAETATTDGLMTGFYRIELDGGRVQPLLEEIDKGYVVDTSNIVDNLLALPRTGEILYVAEDARHPADLWLFNAKQRRSKQLSRLNPKISGISMGDSRLLDWTGRDGKEHRGVLLLPSAYRSGQRYPLVVWIYPMAATQFANKFGYVSGTSPFNVQLLATRGYAVLMAGAPLTPGEPMQAVADWALPGLDAAIRTGAVDADRIGVIGYSAGAYCVLSLIVQSTRFKAAVEGGGSGNLLSWYGTWFDETGYSHGEFNAENGFGMAGHPWAAREQYIRNSPWFFLDRVTAPLLIVQGTDDWATYFSQANEVFVGLRRLGKEVDYALYDGEPHGFKRMANQIDIANRYLEWFDKHLKATPKTNAEANPKAH